MTDTLPISFTAFKQTVLSTLAACSLNVDVTRSGVIWTAKFDDGIKMIGIPVKVGMMTSVGAAEGFARAALAMAVQEFAENDEDAEPAVMQ